MGSSSSSGGRNRGVGRPDYAVCNPATEQLVAVPGPGRPSPGPVSEVRTYLIFDPAVSPHFHLVHIWQEDFLGVIEVRAYSSETRAWSDWASQPRRSQDGGGWKRWVNGGAILTSTGACVNGMVYLIISNMQGKYLITMLDREGKMCGIIRWPDNRDFPRFVGQSQGLLHCVGLLLEREENCLKWAGLSIWVLKDYDTEEWVLKHRKLNL
ncbi:hypothetical protein PVAP13_2KG098416 [Panicum virgatum]|uniref:F-box associated domain-containing protein n=1 Tax=Panicum virgatum TaxID=38727 RepID=A0A8T0VWD6_PANVG|nr:hypothetical protein PVAP13_2KG098416 [Panicum virgatum]